MNKNFMLLNDKTIEVINEEGKEINRGVFENNNAKGILLAENKIEMIDNFKERFDREVSENKKVLKMSSSMLKFQIVLFIALPLFGFLYGAINNPNTWLIHAISECIYAFAGSIIPIATATIYWSIIRPKYKKNIRHFDLLIDKTEDMKKEYEKELEIEQEKIVSYTLEPLVKISLEEENITNVNQIADTLRKYHQQNIKEKGKTRIRKR